MKKISLLVLGLLLWSAVAQAGNTKPIGIAYADPEFDSVKVGSTEMSATEFGYLDGVTPGTQAASKVVIADANTNIGVVKATALHIGTSGSETQVTATGAELNILDNATATAAELNYLDITTLGTGAASKAVVLDTGDDYTWPATGVLTYGVLKDPAATTITATGAEFNYLDITTLGTGAASKAVVLDAGDDYTWPSAGILTYGVLKDSAGTTLGATVAELNGAADLSTQVMTAGAGFAGTGTIYKVSAVKHGSVIVTTFLLDLTGAASSVTDVDIIGTSGVSYIGQITAALNGTVLGGKMTCLEVPAGGADDIDLYFATEGTGAFDGIVTDLAETALITAGEAWAAGASKFFAADPAANSYLYLTAGEASAAGTYTAGRFLIEIWGY